MLKRKVILDGVERVVQFGRHTLAIPLCTGVAFNLRQGEVLTVFASQGGEVSDLTACSPAQPAEWLLGGSTGSYANPIRPSVGEKFYSNQSTPMFTMIEATRIHARAAAHPALAAPRERETCEEPQGSHYARPHNYSHLEKNLAPLGISAKPVRKTLSFFIGAIPAREYSVSTTAVRHSRPGYRSALRAETDLIVGLTSGAVQRSHARERSPIEFTLSGA